MNQIGRNVLTSQGRVTRSGSDTCAGGRRGDLAGVMSGTYGATPSTFFARATALASVLLGTFLVAVLPTLSAAAGYLGALTLAFALLAEGGGAWLWYRDTLLPRTVVGIGALATVAGALLLLIPGLPGARDLDGRPAVEGIVVLLLAVAVGVLLVVEGVVDGARHRPVHQPDHPYAL